MLAGPAFIAVFTVSGAVIGLAADYVHRPRLLSGAVFTYSLAITLTGLATTYWQLVLLRMLLAAGYFHPSSLHQPPHFAHTINNLHNLLGSLPAPQSWCLSSRTCLPPSPVELPRVSSTLVSTWALVSPRALAST